MKMIASLKNSLLICSKLYTKKVRLNKMHTYYKRTLVLPVVLYFFIAICSLVQAQETSREIDLVKAIQNASEARWRLNSSIDPSPSAKHCRVPVSS